jgi:MazG family protein
VTALSDGRSLDALLEVVRTKSTISFADGFSLVPETSLAGAGIDLRMPLLVTRGETVADELPGRMGAGFALLTRLYGADHLITLLPAGETIRLGDITVDAPSAWEAALVPPLAPLSALASPWALPWISARLRAPDGCPWDREQTHLTLAKHLIEEAWELHDAIEAHAANPGKGTEAGLMEELGDVFLQVVLHSQLASERGAFDLTGVQEGIARKIIRRHPHVFGEGTAETTRDVQRTWEAIKAEERAERAAAESTTPRDQARPFASALDGVSRGLPALSASRELQDRASSLGYDWPNLDGVREKLDEELQELSEALTAAGNPDSITGRSASGAAALAAAQDELGDVIAVLVNLGRRSGIDAEAALRGANDKFRRRFSEVEASAATRGIELKSADFATLDALWDEAKAVERSQQ